MKIKEIISKIEPLSMDEALRLLAEKAKSGKTFVVTINPEIVMLMKKDPQYRKAVDFADLMVADGAGIIWAGSVFGKNFQGRIHGVDLVDALSGYVAEKDLSVGFLGGRDNVARVTADKLKTKYKGLDVAFAEEDWVEKQQADILFVAFGSPKQEKWIYENLGKLNAHVIIGVGGAFDFISGRVRRAPLLVQRLYLEWLFRLIRQPWRIKRQTQLIFFSSDVLKERIFG